MMQTRIIVLRAGSAASNNLMRSLKAASPSLQFVGCHEDRFALSRSIADHNYLVPPPFARDYAETLNKIIEAERVRLVVPNSEPDVGIVSQLRARLRCRTFVPSWRVIQRCWDKYGLAMFLARNGLPVPLQFPVQNIDQVEAAFRKLPAASRFWCRMRSGTGSAGAIPVDSPAHVRGWIRYWEEMRGIPPGQFVLSEYLPGRDLTVQCLLSRGRLVMTKMYEKLSYHVAGGSPSNVSSTTAVAKMIHEPRLIRICHKAISAIDPGASSVYFVDLKENAKGEARITEINAGRFANVPVIHDAAGPDNIAWAYVRLALGETVPPSRRRGPGGECYVMRDLDMPAGVYGAREIRSSIERSVARVPGRTHSTRRAPRRSR